MPSAKIPAEQTFPTRILTWGADRRLHSDHFLFHLGVNQHSLGLISDAGDGIHRAEGTTANDDFLDHDLLACSTSDATKLAPAI